MYCICCAQFTFTSFSCPIKNPVLQTFRAINFWLSNNLYLAIQQYVTWYYIIIISGLSIIMHWLQRHKIVGSNCVSLLPCLVLMCRMFQRLNRMIQNTPSSCWYPRT